MGLIRDYIQARREHAQELRATRKSVEDLIKGGVPSWVLSSGQGVKPDFSKQNLVEKYKGWAYTCSNRNAIAVSRAVLRLYSTRATGQQRAGKAYGREIGRPVDAKVARRLKSIKWLAESPRVKQAAELEEIDEHPFLTLMQNVNDWENQVDLMLKLSLYLDNTGDTYWHVIPTMIAGRPVPDKLWTMPSQLVRIVPDAKNYIKGYLYGKPSQEQAFTPEQVIHFLRPHLTNIYYGMSRIEGAWWSITGMESYERYEQMQTENHGIKDMLIQYKSGIHNSKQRRDLMNEWANAMRLASKTHAPLIGDEEFEIKEASWSPKEIAFLRGREWRKPEIISAYGQHESMYDKSANVANIERAIYIWEKYEVEATLRLIEQKLTEKLLPMYGEDRLFCAFDSIVGDDKDFVLRQEEADLKNQIRTVNEVRESRGWDPVPYGDVPLVPFNIVPLGSAPAPTGTNTGPNQPPLKMIPSESGRVKATAPAGGTTHLIVVKANGEVDRELLERTGGAVAPMTRQQKRLSNVMKSVWSAQSTLALEQAVQQAAANFAWIASEEWAQEIIRLSRGVIGEFVELGAQRGGEQIGVSLIDFIDRPTVQHAIENHSFKFAQAVNQNSADQLRLAMSEGMARGESVRELQRRVQGVFQDWDAYRAERVARTESARALMFGEEEQWKESGVVSAKIWDAQGDACPFCLDMNGKTVAIGEAYWKVAGQNQTVDFNGRQIALRHEYLDVMGPPLHPNCRCALRAQLIET